MIQRRNSLIVLARRIRWLIRVFGGILCLLFGYLKLRGVPVGQSLGAVSAEIFLKGALITYFFSWYFGTINDVNDQKLVYYKVPNRGQLPWQGILICFLLAGVFGVLCYVDSSRQFIVMLVLFLLINLIGWAYLVKTFLPTVIHASRAEFAASNQYANLAKLDIVWQYLTGKWQCIRFVYGFIAIGGVALLGFTDLATKFNKIYPAIPASTYVALSLLLYVVTLEGWIWAMRIKSKISQHAVDQVHVVYNLVPR